MGTQGPKKPNWLVLGAFGGSGDAFSWTRKAKLLIEQLKALSCSMSNLVRIPMRGKWEMTHQQPNARLQWQQSLGWAQACLIC